MLVNSRLAPGKPTKKRYGWAPLCLRFKPGDLKRIKAAAKKAKTSCSMWIRTLTRDRARLILTDRPRLVLTFTTPGARQSDQVCVRFSPDEMTDIQQAAEKEGSLSSPWIRAVVLSHLGNG
jgi:uncharacterized protein (DUF1778 family)